MRMEGEGNKNLVGVESTGVKIGGGGMSKFLSGGWRIPSNPPPPSREDPDIGALGCH